MHSCSKQPSNRVNAHYSLIIPELCCSQIDSLSSHFQSPCSPFQGKNSSHAAACPLATPWVPTARPTQLCLVAAAKPVPFLPSFQCPLAIPLGKPSCFIPSGPIRLDHQLFAAYPGGCLLVLRKTSFCHCTLHIRPLSDFLLIIHHRYHHFLDH